ncbi:unnamed protein product [Heligmosomoides polygyrus]|uniref:Uncharacterized protein n=1 Tax=Heligmosomoides polygyrus TaxID=6339 RepID=A0A183G1W9_HELPZ|nr:unnamed protein product [Heligmosomoides polygyrus]
MGCGLAEAAGDIRHDFLVRPRKKEELFVFCAAFILRLLALNDRPAVILQLFLNTDGETQCGQLPLRDILKWRGYGARSTDLLPDCVVQVARTFSPKLKRPRCFVVHQSLRHLRSVFTDYRS